MPIFLGNFLRITDLAFGPLLQELQGRKPPGDKRMAEWTFQQSSGNFPISGVFSLLRVLANRFVLQALEENWILCAPYCEGLWRRAQDLGVSLPGFEFIFCHLLSLWLWGFNLLGASISSFVNWEQAKSILQRDPRGLHKIIYVKCFEEKLAYRGGSRKKGGGREEGKGDGGEKQKTFVECQRFLYSRHLALHHSQHIFIWASQEHWICLLSLCYRRGNWEFGEIISMHPMSY